LEIQFTHVKQQFVRVLQLNVYI